MRKGAITRKTNETSIEVGLDLDGSGLADVTTGIGFFDHMLDQLSRHSLVDMKIRAEGARRQARLDAVCRLPAADGRNADSGRARRVGPAVPRVPDRVSDREDRRF